jgi:hypothetical protein
MLNDKPQGFIRLSWGDDATAESHSVYVVSVPVRMGLEDAIETAEKRLLSGLANDRANDLANPEPSRLRKTHA